MPHYFYVSEKTAYHAYYSHSISCCVRICFFMKVLEINVLLNCVSVLCIFFCLWEYLIQFLLHNFKFNNSKYINSCMMYVLQRYTDKHFFAIIVYIYDPSVLKFSCFSVMFSLQYNSEKFALQLVKQMLNMTVVINENDLQTWRNIVHSNKKGI